MRAEHPFGGGGGMADGGPQSMRLTALVPAHWPLRQLRLVEMFFECVRKPDQLSVDIRDDQVISLFDEASMSWGWLG
jgi:hypothetical protein